jgi:alkylation response protein AidB-like acyl-CoA dehydrogenase
MNYFSDEKEWKWLFENGLDWEKILPLYHSSFPTEDGHQTPQEVKEFYEELLGATGEWAGTSVADRAERMDREGAGTLKDGKTVNSPALDEFYQEAKELELYAMGAPKEYGGLELPMGLGLILIEQVSRACISSCMQISFHGSIIDMLDRFASKEIKDKYIPEIIADNISGSMCLTEPDCGSDLGSLSTSATPQEDGTYLINGTKIFITNGGGGIGLVLARIDGDKEGLPGISMFLADQREAEDGLNYKITNNENKMGLHGTFTTEVLYENTKAHLIGNPGEGFKMMLHLMNEARVATAMQSFGGLEASIAYAKQYASERKAFGKPIAELPLMKRNLNDYQTEVDALRALLVDTTSHYDIYQRLHLKKQHTGSLNESEQELYDDSWMWIRKRTPLVKFYATEAFTQLSTKAIQVLGGYGYMKDYPVEKLHRDSFGPLLYEGTSQIQSLMALKDLLKYALKDPKSFLTNVISKHPGLTLISGTSEWEKEYKTTHYRFKKKLVGLLFSNLRPETENILDLGQWMKMDEDKVSGLMVHAETLCAALSYMETLRVLCDHSNKDEERSQLFFNYLRLIRPRLEAIYTDWNQEY